MLLDLLKSTPLMEWDVGVCCPPETPIIEELKKLSVTVFPTFIAGLHLKGTWSRLVALKNLTLTVLRFRPDLIYVNQAGVTRLALLAARINHIPVISSVKLVEDIERLETLKAKAEALPKIICVSQYIINGFKNNGIVPTRRLAMIYDPYEPEFDWKEGPREETSVTVDSFACIARVAYSKGQDVVLHALAELKRRDVSANVTFVGSSGPGEIFGEEMTNLTRELEVEDRANWVGTKKDFFAFGAGCIAWLCPSRHDPFPRVMLAALDAGTLPIAWVGSGGPAEMIKASGGGILYDRQNGRSLAEAMIRAMKMTNSARKDMVSKGRAWVHDHCSPTKSARKTVDLWAGVLDAKSD